MAKKNGPYVGVTGFMSRSEVDAALKVIPEGSSRCLMVGVLVTTKTLLGRANMWPNRCPQIYQVADIFSDDPRALNLIHYSTDYPELLFGDLCRMTELARPRLDGFQLNIAWPSIPQLREWRKMYPDQYLVLQIGDRAIEIAESTGGFESFLEGYVGVVDAVLVDASSGTGKPLDSLKGAEYLRVAQGLSMETGIAGGLGFQTLHLINPLLTDFPRLSIDAQTQLRTALPEDALHIGAMRMYLEDAFPILEGKELPGSQLIRRSISYDLKGHIRHRGLGINMLRMPRFAQPCALNTGDVLVTGDRLLSPPREGGNGSIWLHLTGGFEGHWVEVPSRIPIALLTDEDNAPSDLCDK